MNNYHLTISQALDSLKKEREKRFVQMLQHGSMIIEYYAPVGKDLQTPHRQDELYIVISGKGEFYRDGERMVIGKGDVLFVPAGMEHKFENFSEDFSTWVIFYGPDGGEK